MTNKDSIQFRYFQDTNVDLLLENYPEYGKVKNTVTCQRIARQRLDKRPAIRARNSRTNVYSWLLANSQRANGLTR
jgi:hypothetical protein